MKAAPAMAVFLAILAMGDHARGQTVTASAGSDAVGDAAMNIPDRPSPDMRKDFADFRSALWPDADKRGISRALFDKALGALEPDSEIFELLVNQPEHVTTPWDYLNRLASDQRIESGRRLLADHAVVLDAIERRYGVDRYVLVAIWGIESNFGGAPGTRSVIRSLATLAVGEPRRAAFWRTELLTALAILQRGDITLDRMTGSWAGAMGHTQFMPSSYMAHAVDFDGDGRRDIWDSIPDALASTANYMKTAGWRRGEPWGLEVVLPERFDFALAGPGVVRTIADWKALGLLPPSVEPWPNASSPASVLLPAGARGPAFVTMVNFRAILKYNNATSYALAVGHLADRLRGAPPIAGPWPLDDPPLGKTAREELQQRLSALGHDTGGLDGVVGNQTRAAIRAYQRQSGLPQDGYASERLLVHLRASAAP